MKVRLAMLPTSRRRNISTESHAHCLVKTVFRFNLQATKPVITAWLAVKKCCINADIKQGRVMVDNQ
jgi:hypothetical protein